MPLPLLMGVVNVTPDSFSDGGRYATAEAAVAHGRRLLADGADILDIGGESTRPGATRPLVAEELDRVVPVITALAGGGRGGLVDTMRAEVAEAALAAGARIVNDVSGGLADPDILRVVAGSEATYVAMHWRAHSDRMTDFATYDGPGGVVAAVRAELGQRVEAILAAGDGRGPAGARPRARVRQARRAQLGAARGTWTRSPRWATRCWSGPAASRSSARCSRTPTGRRAAGRRARARHHRAHRGAGPGGGVGAARARRTLLPRRPAGAGGSGPAREETRACMTVTSWPCRAGVLGPPRRLRARAPRGAAVRRRPGAGHRHRRPRRRPTTCQRPSTTEVSPWR